MNRSTILPWFCFGILILSCGVLPADEPRVAIVVGPDAPALEQYAASELRTQIQRVFQATANVGNTAAPDATHVILVGTPATNPAIQAAAADNWPALSAQGHVVRTVRLKNRAALVVGGGSPVATLWAAYELGYHWGVRYLAHGDVDPSRPGKLNLENVDILIEPRLPVRGAMLIDTFVTSTELWSLEQHQKLLRQLAKLKFNRVELRLHPWQPFVDFEYRGIKKQTSVLSFGWQYPIDANTAGRAAFRGVSEFTNPDFAGKSTYAERTAVGVALIRGIIRTAHELGMSATISISVLDFPPEFASVLPGAQPCGFENLCVGPADDADTVDSNVMELATAQLQAYVETYSEIDGIALQSGPDQTTLLYAEYLTSCPTDEDFRKLLPGRRREYRKNLTDISLDVIQQFRHLYAKSDRPRIGGLEQPVLSAPALPASLLPLTVANAVLNVHSPGTSLADTAVILDIPTITALTPAAHCMSRDGLVRGAISKQAGFDELVIPVAGLGAAERFNMAWDMIESATRLLRQHDHFVAVPAPGMLMRQYYNDETPPAWWKETRDLYVGAMNEMYRANQRAREADKPFTRYGAKRLESAFHYFNAIEATRLAGIAARKKETDAAIEQLEKAVESMYSAADCVREVARDPSDVGIIAALNEFGYRPLLRQLDNLQSGER